MGSPPETVCAVVLTHNRHAMLQDCLDRVQGQSRPVDLTLVVDNASTDATAEVLAGRPAVDVVRLNANLGAAGGFAAGIRAAYERGTDWIWLLDDDTLPDDDCLEALLAGARRAPDRAAVVASVVSWRDGRLHPLNIPMLRLGRRGQLAQAAASGLVAIRAASWVSTMVRREAVAEHGLPNAHYFLWVEDVEYTARILRDSHGYWVPESRAGHLTAQPTNTSTDSGTRFYYKVRNQLWALRGSAFDGAERGAFARACARSVADYVASSTSRTQAVRTVARGVLDGLRREPT